MENLLNDFCNDNTYVCLMSDHGFDELKGEFKLLKWLSDKGYVSINKKTFIPRLLNLFKLNRDSLLNTAKRLKMYEFLMKIIPRRFLFSLYGYLPTKKGEIGRGFGWEKMINLKKSRVIPIGNTLYINEKNIKNYEKFRDALIKELKELKDPHTGKSIYDNVYKKEEIYKGEFLEEAPDIVLYSKDFVTISNISKEEYIDYEKNRWSGYHDLFGIFILFGKGIKRNKKINVNITDIAPTILHIFGLPIPKDMDGRVLTEIFEEDSEFAKREPKYVDPSYYEKKDEEEKIKGEIERLKKLGKI